MEVKNKKAVILGAARSGIAAAELLLQKGAEVFVSDSASETEKKEEIKILEGLGVSFEFDSHTNKLFDGDFVVLSPGIPVASEIVRNISKKGIPIFSELEIAYWFCQSPIIAITGSNGKTTTTTLLGEMLRSIKSDSIVAGNIGTPFSGQVLSSDRSTWAAVEISSFQLETIDSFHPRIAVILNFAPNHLDRYNSYEDYTEAKLRIIKNLDHNDYIIYNADDILISKKIHPSPAKKLSFSQMNNQADAYLKDAQIFMFNKAIMSCGEVLLKGNHNYMNAMAASLAAHQAEIPNVLIAQTLETFRGVEHRIEVIGTINGIHFVNDSKATTIESLSVALKSFNTPIILIAGGKDKGSDFTKINDLIKKNVREVVLIGESKEKIAKSWNNLKPIHFADSLAAAVEKAFTVAKQDDNVLLSPACTSFDMFKDYEDRGRIFKQIVKQLMQIQENA